LPLKSSLIHSKDHINNKTNRANQFRFLTISWEKADECGLEISRSKKVSISESYGVGDHFERGRPDEMEENFKKEKKKEKRKKKWDRKKKRSEKQREKNLTFWKSLPIWV
jgi:hypothetical protein